MIPAGPDQPWPPLDGHSPDRATALRRARNIRGVFDVCCTLAVDSEAQP